MEGVGLIGEARPRARSPLATSLLLTCGLALVPLLLVDLFPSALHVELGSAAYLVFHNVAEFFGVMVAFSIFGVGWYTHGQSRDRHALFLACAFLAIGLMDFMHTLSYAGMPDFVTPSSANKASQFWVAVRSFSAVAFLASAFVRSDASSPWLSRRVLGAAAIVIPAAVFVVLIFFPSHVPAAFVSGVGQTPFKRRAEYAIVALLAAAIAAHWRRFSRTRDPSAALYLAAFALCAFSELFFAAYRSVTDTRNALGHVYKVVAFYLVYRGIFIASVQRPHRELQETAEALRREMAERAAAEAALARSQEEIDRERRRMEEHVRQSRKMEAVGRLAGGVAHDFNNLLTAILGATDQVIEGLPPSSPLREDARDIQLAARKAAALTNQLLTFSRKQVVLPRVIAIDELVTGLVQMLERLIGEDVELVAKAPPGVGRVRADPGQIEQVIVNLVVNARDAMPKGGRVVLETADVEIGEEGARRLLGIRPGRYVLLSVADTGLGMDAEVMSHLFEPFFTTKGPGKGTGLGLSTIYGIVKQAGGHVRVESAPGAGSVFRIYLPRVDEEVAAPEPPTAAATAPLSPATVLLVEDELAVRSVILKVLRRAGYAVLDAGDGEEALKRAEDEAQRIDVLVTDVVMPRMGGVELASRIRSMRPGLKVLFISGYVEQGFALATLDESTRFLQKPFTPAVLEEELSRLLEPSAPGAAAGEARGASSP